MNLHEGATARDRNSQVGGHRADEDDMLNLPHHQSSTRHHINILNRAAQFSPFAALTGYNDKVRETARLTDEKIELLDNEKERLD